MPDPITLTGPVCTLEPLSHEHADGLAAAGSGDRSSFGFTWVPDGLEQTKAYIDYLLAQQQVGSVLPFAVRDNTGAVVGSTRFLDMQVIPAERVPGSGVPPTTRAPLSEQVPTVLEIGGTWYRPASQQSGVNAQAKLLLLTQTFEAWGCQRATLKTDARNSRSRAAIERLGATYEGVRRADCAAVDGGLRDTAGYSIVLDQWPVVRAELLRRLPAAGD
jgi:RimJ/RimL family protein N-acetyltransferase